MKLRTIELPSPREMRGGWAALAAILAARGWGEDAYATINQWYYHDGGGNWASLRFIAKDKAVLIGHDHEYSETYFGENVEDFGKETDLLAGAPNWWGINIDPKPSWDIISFIYGWDGQKWQRADYELEDGFRMVGLLEICDTSNTELFIDSASDAPGLNGKPPALEALKDLLVADAKITPALLEAVVPGWNIEAGVEAARKFLDADL